MSQRSFTFKELCRDVGKNHVVVGQIQAGLDLPVLTPPKTYKRGYVNFIKKCIALRTFGVPLGDIQDLFRKEMKVLRLLNFHTLSRSPTWFLDHCVLEGKDPHRLLLTGYTLGFDPNSGQIQGGLDFADKTEELFESHQMGEHLDHVIDLYRRQVAKVRRRVEEERPLIRTALSWSTRVFEDPPARSRKR